LTIETPYYYSVLVQWHMRGEEVGKGRAKRRLWVWG